MKQVRILKGWIFVACCLLGGLSGAEADGQENGSQRNSDALAELSTTQQPAKTQLQKNAMARVRKLLDVSKAGDGEASAKTKATKEAIDAIEKVVREELQAREKRIADARNRLDALEAKLKHNRLNIDRLMQGRLERMLQEAKALKDMEYTSPEALVHGLNEAAANNDVDRVVACFDEDGVQDIAAILLTMCASVQLTSAMAQFLESNEPNDPVWHRTKNLLGVLHKSQSLSPPAEAMNAYGTLASVFAGTSAGSLSIAQMRRATGILQDPREFVISGLKVFGCKEVFSLSETIDSMKVSVIEEDPPRALIAMKGRNDWLACQREGVWRIHHLLREPLFQAQPMVQPASPADDGPVFHAAEVAGPVFHAAEVAWPVYPEPLPPALPEVKPLYEGQTLSQWLHICFSSVSSGKEEINEKAFNAVARFRSREDSLPEIRQQMQIWYAGIENELSDRRLAQVAKSIAMVAGRELRDEAIDYLFKINRLTSKQVAEDSAPFGGLVFQETTHVLSEAFAEIHWDTEMYISTIIDPLKNGPSRDRELAIAGLLHPPKSIHEVDYSQSLEALVEALLAASHDQAEHIAVSAAWFACMFSSAEPPQGHHKSKILNRLEAILGECESLGNKVVVLHQMHELDPKLPIIEKTIQTWAQSSNQFQVDAAIKAGESIEAFDLLADWLKDPKWAEGMQANDRAASLRFNALHALGGADMMPNEALSIFEGERNRNAKSDAIPDTNERRKIRELCENMLRKIKTRQSGTEPQKAKPPAAEPAASAFYPE